MSNLDNLKSAYMFEERRNNNVKEDNERNKQYNFEVLYNNVNYINDLKENLIENYMLLDNGFLYLKYGVLDFVLEYSKTLLFFKTYLDHKNVSPISDYVGNDFIYTFLKGNKLLNEDGNSYERNFKLYSGKKYLKDISDESIIKFKNKEDFVNKELYKIIVNLDIYLKENFNSQDTIFLNKLNKNKNNLEKFNTLCESVVGNSKSYPDYVQAFMRNFTVDIIRDLENISKG